TRRTGGRGSPARTSGSEASSLSAGMTTSMEPSPPRPSSPVPSLPPTTGEEGERKKSLSFKPPLSRCGREGGSGREGVGGVRALPVWGGGRGRERGGWGSEGP